MSSGSARRHAVRTLGEALRELNEAAVASEMDAQTLHRVADQVRENAAALRERTREVGAWSTVDLGERPRRMFNPAAGPGSPLAPPMRVEMSDTAAVGRCTLGLVYEGPPSYCHGGISALLLDQILGHVHAAHGSPGMTARLSMRYRRPVPLRTPLVITGRLVAADDDRWSNSVASIATEEEPDVLLVEAEARFVVPNATQVERLFGSESRSAAVLRAEPASERDSKGC